MIHLLITVISLTFTVVASLITLVHFRKPVLKRAGLSIEAVISKSKKVKNLASYRPVLGPEKITMNVACVDEVSRKCLDYLSKKGIYG